MELARPQDTPDFSSTIESPQKCYEVRTRMMMNEFDVKVIHREVYAFYERKEYPTLSSLLMQQRWVYNIMESSA